MATSFVVTGPGLVKVGTGTAAALELLGYTEDGARIEITSFKGELKTDVGGRMAPAELYEMGEIAWVRIKLTAYDSAILAKVRRGGRSAEGDAGSIGRLAGTNAAAGTAFDAFRLLIDCSSEPWNFPTACLRDRHNYRVSTEPYQPELSFYCWVFIPGSATSGSTDLYNRTTS